jgi:hypothetical protein
VGAADCDDLLDLISRIQLELPPQALRVGRLPGRRPLKPDDRVAVPDSQKAGKLLALINPFETEQLVKRTLGVQAGPVDGDAEQPDLRRPSMGDDIALAEQNGGYLRAHLVFQLGSVNGCLADSSCMIIHDRLAPQTHYFAAERTCPCVADAVREGASVQA